MALKNFQEHAKICIFFFPPKLLSIPGFSDRKYKPDLPDCTAGAQEPPCYLCHLSCKPGKCRPLA